MKKNPFASIDQTGVGQLMQIAITKGRQTRPDIKLGICGEHGGDPDSVKFCHKLGLTYVSCSPFRVPSPRLAAAQAAVADLKNRLRPRAQRGDARSPPTKAPGWERGLFFFVGSDVRVWVGRSLAASRSEAQQDYAPTG